MKDALPYLIIGLIGYLVFFNLEKIESDVVSKIVNDLLTGKIKIKL